MAENHIISAQIEFLSHVFSYLLLWSAFTSVDKTLFLSAQRSKWPWLLRSSGSVHCFLGLKSTLGAGRGVRTRRVQMWLALHPSHHPRCWVFWHYSMCFLHIIWFNYQTLRTVNIHISQMRSLRHCEVSLLLYLEMTLCSSACCISGALPVSLLAGDNPLS